MTVMAIIAQVSEVVPGHLVLHCKLNTLCIV